MLLYSPSVSHNSWLVDGSSGSKYYCTLPKTNSSSPLKIGLRRPKRNIINLSSTIFQGPNCFVLGKCFCLVAYYKQSWKKTCFRRRKTVDSLRCWSERKTLGGSAPDLNKLPWGLQLPCLPDYNCRNQAILITLPTWKNEFLEPAVGPFLGHVLLIFSIILPPTASIGLSTAYLLLFLVL